jgi:3-phosphoshikimate 1-carboxyvinyltransferase
VDPNLDGGKSANENLPAMPPQPTPPRTLTVPSAPCGLSGRVTVPPSKSITQRALVAAALAGGGAWVRRPLDAEDPRLLLAGLQAAGFRLAWDVDGVVATGWSPAAGAEIRMGNNGTGVRFLLAQLAATAGGWTLDGVARLRERPIAPLAEALQRLGAEIAPAGGGPLALPLRVTGRPLDGGGVSLDASASSQFVSALLLLGARLPKGLAVQLAQPPPSRPYLALTVEVMRAFSADAGYDENALRAWVAPGTLQPCELVVEGDWSAAAFPLAGVAVAGGSVVVDGVGADSRQGDAAMLAILAAAGCRIATVPGGVAVEGPATRPVRADLRDTPDLFPALAVVAAAVGGALTGLEGLAAKESDRLGLMAANLIAMGFRVATDGRSLTSPGARPTRSAAAAALPCAADHRIAMALAVAGLVAAGVTVDDADCVAKSWPGFWASWTTLTAGRP